MAVAPEEVEDATAEEGDGEDEQDVVDDPGVLVAVAGVADRIEGLLVGDRGGGRAV